MSGDLSELLRGGLLDEAMIVLAGAPGSPDDGIREALSALGGTVADVALRVGDGPEAEEQIATVAMGEALKRLGSVHTLVIDGASLFGAGEGREALMGCLASAWNAARAAVQLAFLPGEAGGQIVLVTPADGAEHAAAAAAGLENLARTLSIEWARYGITTVAIAPGRDTRPEDLGAVVAYLASPAGAYFSGCLMDLRGPGSPSDPLIRDVVAPVTA
jgi:NAD(P)-dependent dehydrogenase (short-subunit alcohol dehydrogenase family)